MRRVVTEWRKRHFWQKWVMYSIILLNHSTIRGNHRDVKMQVATWSKLAFCNINFSPVWTLTGTYYVSHHERITQATLAEDAEDEWPLGGEDSDHMTALDQWGVHIPSLTAFRGKSCILQHFVCFHMCGGLILICIHFFFLIVRFTKHEWYRATR